MVFSLSAAFAGTSPVTETPAVAGSRDSEPFSPDALVDLPSMVDAE